LESESSLFSLPSSRKSGAIFPAPLFSSLPYGEIIADRHPPLLAAPLFHPPDGLVAPLSADADRDKSRYTVCAAA